MPVDYTGVLIAIIFWIGGTCWSFSRIRAAMLAKHDVPANGLLPLVRPLFWTMWASIAFAIAAFFIAMLYDFVIVGF